MNFLKRLTEPSTWAGIAALAAIFGVPTTGVQAAGQIVGGLAALVAIVAPEKAAQ